MGTRRTEYAASFNLWTIQGTWFWLLLYPDRRGGRIGAAASEAEAMAEAKAAIRHLPQKYNDHEAPPAPCDDLPSFGRGPTSTDSQFRSGSRIDDTVNDFAYARV